MAKKQDAKARSGRKTTAARKKRKKKTPCVVCPSTCCHDLAILTTRPRTKEEISELRWHLHYDTVSIAISKHRWHVVVKGRCIYLGDDSLCTIYDHRPDKCRKHNAPDCERFSCWYETLITTPEELDAYLQDGRQRAPSAATRAKDEDALTGGTKHT